MIYLSTSAAAAAMLCLLPAVAMGQPLAAQELAAMAIDEGMFVDINGSPQWITVRGQDRRNPVLLWLHGGPGVPMSGQAPLFAAWEKDYTIVQWDQPGGGATYAKNGPSGTGELSIARYTRDAVTVAEWARQHLRSRKVIVIGTSWGTLLGLELASKRPDLVAGYVGVGQFVSGSKGALLGYNEALRAARERNDQTAIEELEKAGPPPFTKFEDFLVRQKYVNPPFQKPSPAEAAAMAEAGKLLQGPPQPGAKYVATGLPEYDGVQTFLSTQRSMFAPTAQFEAESLGLSFKVPMFFFQGADDLNTPTALVRDYFARIKAPTKRMEIVPDAGHLVVMFHDRLLAFLNREVRPVTLESARPRP